MLVFRLSFGDCWIDFDWFDRTSPRDTWFQRGGVCNYWDINMNDDTFTNNGWILGLNWKRCVESELTLKHKYLVVIYAYLFFKSTFTEFFVNWKFIMYLYTWKEKTKFKHKQKCDSYILYSTYTLNLIRCIRFCLTKVYISFPYRLLSNQLD